MCASVVNRFVFVRVRKSIFWLKRAETIRIVKTFSRR